MVLAALGALAACTVLPTEEAQRIKEHSGASVDVDKYVADAWARAQNDIKTRAIAVAALRGGPDGVDKEKGHRAGEGSSWTYLVEGEGTVRSASTDSPRGQIELDVSGTTVILQTGPVVTGTTIRDALPYVAFNDVSDQIVFAQIGLGLTERALAPLRPTLQTIRPGDTIAFVGAASVPASEDPIVVTPLDVTVSNAS